MRSINFDLWFSTLVCIDLEIPSHAWEPSSLEIDLQTQAFEEQMISETSCFKHDYANSSFISEILVFECSKLSSFLQIEDHDNDMSKS